MVSILLHLLQTSISGYQSISKMEYCYKTRIAVTRDFCQDMEAGVRYSRLRDVFIVDSVRKDNGGLERVVTDFHGTLKKRYKLTVLPKMSITQKHSKSVIKMIPMGYQEMKSR